MELQGARVQVRRVDVTAEGRRERVEQLQAEAAEALALVLDGDGVDESAMALLHEQLLVTVAQVNEAAKRDRVEGWSPKSRRNMLRTIAGLNMPGRWGMLTFSLPGHWLEVCATPEALKAARKAFRRRWEREYGTWSALWKLEFQRRGAPHFHQGVQLPDGVRLVDLQRWCAKNWHEVLCHPSTNRYGGTCPGASCEHAAHVSYGTELDAEYGNRLRTAGSAFASYFAKHGVWASKEYQHQRPGWRMRAGAGLLDLMAGPGAGDGLRAAADTWDHPGRWWGVENVEAAPCAEGEFSPEHVQAAKLVARKVVARRKWRYVEDPDHGVVFVRSSLRSLHEDAGFWLLAGQPSEFGPWFLDQVRKVAAMPPGVERARYLATIEEPGARERPRAARLQGWSGPPGAPAPSGPGRSAGGRLEAAT
ncbi:MAG: hypothetical protein WAN48_09885 [Actinomycetes bacterium]